MRHSALFERAETAGLICPVTGEINIDQPILDVPAARPSNSGNTSYS